ncbi:hypothetical protein HDU99_003571, partial [Rhizoclosmatium hyalinum]
MVVLDQGDRCLLNFIQNLTCAVPARLKAVELLSHGYFVSDRTILPVSPLVNKDERFESFLKRIVDLRKRKLNIIPNSTENPEETNFGGQAGSSSATIPEALTSAPKPKLLEFVKAID